MAFFSKNPFYNKRTSMKNTGIIELFPMLLLIFKKFYNRPINYYLLTKFIGCLRLCPREDSLDVGTVAEDENRRDQGVH